MTCISASSAWAGTVQTACFSSLSSQTRLCSGSRPAISTTVPAGHAITVRARDSGVLRICQGRLWVTFSHADRDSQVPAGDLFLECGESLRLQARQTVVMEPWPRAASQVEDTGVPACVSWEADAPLRPLASVRNAVRRILDIGLGQAA